MSASLRLLASRFFRQIATRLEPSPWTGVYARPEEVSQSGDGFSGSAWEQESKVTLERLREKARGPHFVPDEILSEHLLLPFFASLLSRSQPVVRVLDFGGGYALHYEQLRRCVVDPAKIDYHVLETPDVAARAAHAWSQTPAVHFHAALPHDPSSWDILYFCSSLQYLKDYKAELRSLLQSTSARYVLFVKVMAGDNPTFVTAQVNMAGSSIPYWMFNARVLAELVTSCGYTLIYKSSLERKYPQSGFSPEYQVGSPVNLLFVKS